MADEVYLLWRILHLFFYWRERDDEVDFVLRKKGLVVAIEVKSNVEKRTGGLNRFRKLFNPQAVFIVGDGGISAEDFFSMDVWKLFLKR